MGWRAALNLLEARPGIATRTHVLVRGRSRGQPGHRGVATRKIFSPGPRQWPPRRSTPAAGCPPAGAFGERAGLCPARAFLGGEEELWARLPEIKARAKEGR